VAKSTQAAPVVTLDVSKMPTGVYTVHVVTEDGVYSRKIVKMD
jgi:hypothetical protein